MHDRAGFGGVTEAEEWKTLERAIQQHETTGHATRRRGGIGRTLRGRLAAYWLRVHGGYPRRMT